jgi:arabinose-5-phosphate isomerase
MLSVFARRLLNMSNLSDTHISPNGSLPSALLSIGAQARDISRQQMLDHAREVIRREAIALHALSARLNDQICVLADHILSSASTVVVSGVGKSGIVGEKISATLASTGTRSIVLDPLDALHGSLGRIAPGDIFLGLSNSGEAAELKQIVRAVRVQPVVVAVMTGRATSSLAAAADIVLDIGNMQEACTLGLAPTTSTTAMMALGDALALILLERRGFTRQDFARLHPGGSLGKELMRVRDLMWPLESIPVLSPDTTLAQALIAMCRVTRFPGVAVVLDARAKLVGILTNERIEHALGRNEMLNLAERVDAYMQSPRATIHGDAPVHDAAQVFRDRGGDILAVEDSAACFVGVLSRREVLGEGSFAKAA